VRFRKLGLIYCVDGSCAVMRAHAMAPTPLLLGNIIRIFFASTDDDMVGRVFFVDLDSRDSLRIVGRSVAPVLDAGQPGAFDMHGINPSSLVQHGSELWLYYVGYQRQTVVPYTLLTGLAISRDGGHSFERAGAIPVLPSTEDEQFFRTAAHVHPAKDGFRAWYIGGNRWTEHEGKTLPIYGLRHVRSADGRSWSDRRILLEPDETRGQIGFGRPYVLRTARGYRMYLSVRTVNGYRLSHAVSDDGFSWRDWQSDVIPRSESGWDSEMICYAAAIEIGGNEFVFYNGNGYGRSGFGVAIREA
jgi:hypothetical protein